MNSVISALWKTIIFASLFTFAILIIAFSAWAQVTFPNPIQAADFPELIKNIADAIVTVAVPLAVVALIFAGFKFITGAVSGDPKQLEAAKKIFTWTLIGAAIIVGAWAIATAAYNFAREL